MRNLFVAALAASCALAHATSVTYDDSANYSPNYTSNTAWRTVTTGQVVGADQQVHTGMSAAGVVDNGSAGFSTLGSGWTLATTLPGMVGSNYAVARYYGAPSTYRIPTVVIDNETSGSDYGSNYGCVGANPSTGVSGYYGRDYSVILKGSSPSVNRCQFSSILRFAGNAGGTAHVTLSAHWPAIATNASNARFTATTGSGTVLGTWLVNQKIASGEWAAIGSFDVGVSSTVYITVDAQNADGNAIGDAIKLEASDAATMTTAKWQLPSNLYGRYDVYAHVPYSTTAEAMPALTLVGGDGSHRSLNASERLQPQQWVLIGTADLSGTQSNYVLLQQWVNTGDLLADAVAYAPSGTFPIATWQSTSSKPSPTGNVTVKATWGADSTRTHRAVYSVMPYAHTALGCPFGTPITKVVDQTLPSGSGTVLGTVYVDPACPGPIVTLTPDADTGTVSADSITMSN